MASSAFLNVDLELGARTAARLAPLVEELSEKLHELFRGPMRGLYRAHYEGSFQAATASATIRRLVRVIDGMSPAAKRAWRAARVRDFNVGVELSPGARAIELAIDADAVKQVAELGARLAFTAYRGRKR